VIEREKRLWVEGQKAGGERGKENGSALYVVSHEMSIGSPTSARARAAFDLKSSTTCGHSGSLSASWTITPGRSAKIS